MVNKNVELYNLNVELTTAVEFYNELFLEKFPGVIKPKIPKTNKWNKIKRFRNDNIRWVYL